MVFKIYIYLKSQVLLQKKIYKKSTIYLYNSYTSTTSSLSNSTSNFSNSLSKFISLF